MKYSGKINYEGKGRDFLVVEVVKGKDMTKLELIDTDDKGDPRTFSTIELSKKVGETMARLILKEKK